MFLFIIPLQRLCGANIDVAVNTAVYTGMFNTRGGFEADLTVLRLAENEFYIISGTILLSQVLQL